MKEIKFFMNEYMFLANSLLLLCYLQSNLLMFRLLFIAACLFFLIFSLTLPVVSIDTVIFNILFTIINVTLSIPLIKKLVPPSFTQEQKDIYREHFRNYLSPIELNFLLQSGRKKIFRVTSNVMKIGNEFSSLFFIGKVGKNCKVELKTKRRSLELTEYSWIGIPEYLNIISRKDSLNAALKEFDTGEWGVNVNVIVDKSKGEFEFDENLFDADEILDIQNNMSISSALNLEDNIVVMYEFELRNIEKVFSDPDNGVAIMRGLHSRWLKYCSDIVKKVDQTNVSIQTGMNTTSVSYLKRSNTAENKFKKGAITPEFNLIPEENIHDTNFLGDI